MIESFHRVLQKLFCRLGHFDTKAQSCQLALILVAVCIKHGRVTSPAWHCWYLIMTSQGL